MFSGVSRFSWLKVAAACLALGLHAGVLAMVLSSRVVAVAPGQPEALDVQFVELGPVEEASPAAASSADHAPQAEIEPTLEPVPSEPEPERESELEPEPAPEPQVEPEPAPEPVAAQPEPESVVETPPPPKPKPVVKPKPRPKPVVKPKPEPRPRPKPVLQPKPSLPAPAARPSRKAVAASGSAPESPQARGERTAPDVDQPRTVGRVDYLGQRPRPAYPRLSERRGEQGRVVLRVLISPQGRVADVKVQRSSGYGRLDDAAVAAMRPARFRPYTENGIAYKALVDIPFDFVL